MTVLYLQVHPVSLMNTNDSAMGELVEYKPMNSSCTSECLIDPAKYEDDLLFV